MQIIVYNASYSSSNIHVMQYKMFCGGFSIMNDNRKCDSMKLLFQTNTFVNKQKWREYSKYDNKRKQITGKPLH